MGVIFQGPRFGQKRAENEFVGENRVVCLLFICLFALGPITCPFLDLTLAQGTAFPRLSRS